MGIRHSPAIRLHFLVTVVTAICLLSEPALAQLAGAGLHEFSVRSDGQFAVTRFDKTGNALAQYTGFSRIADLTLYDEYTVLIAEIERARVTALSLDGKLQWTLRADRPSQIEVLGPDRFLIATDTPCTVREFNRQGEILWELPRLFECGRLTGVARLPDGNTAIVDAGQHAIRILTPEGRVAWSSKKGLAQPHGLALLSTGELVTSGFDSQHGVVYRPYTTESREFEYRAHGVDVTAVDDWDILVAWTEMQVVKYMAGARSVAWEFQTLYPPQYVEMMPDRTVLVSHELSPDVARMGAERIVAEAEKPLAPYWFWLWTGLAVGLATVGGLRRRVFSRHVARVFRREEEIRTLGREVQPTSGNTILTVRRRLELAAYVVTAIALTVVAALFHSRLLGSGEWGPFSGYVALLAIAGTALALVQYRLPLQRGDWPERIRTLTAMESPTSSMWISWGLGLVTVCAGLFAQHQTRADWPVAAWVAGLLLLLGGSVQAPGRRLRPNRWHLLAAGALFLFLTFIRLWRLETIPANLHLDMAQWSTQTLDLIHGRVDSILNNGWAEIPLLGYLWSALFTSLGGGSVAACRLSSVVGSLIAIVAVFSLMRRFYGFRAAFVAALLLGVNHGFLHFSRIQHYMDPVTFHVLAVAALAAGLESGRYSPFALSGLCAGYSALTYHAGRISPPAILGLVALFFLCYPRVFLRRWRGLLLSATLVVATLAPQALVYATGGSDPFGRSDQFDWTWSDVDGWDRLKFRLQEGIVKVPGTFWHYTDSSTQYGGSAGPLLEPISAALMGVASVAALVRPVDVRGLWILGWAVGVFFVGGVLTQDPPFWPRIVISFVPVILSAAVSFEWLYRGARVAFGRVGVVLAAITGSFYLLYAADYQLGIASSVARGILPGQHHPSMQTEWVQGILGRDIQKWGDGAMVYIVARNPMDASCTGPVLSYYDYYVDSQNAREIRRYMPFDSQRPVAIYFMPDSFHQIAAVQREYPESEIKVFRDNLGGERFKRLVIRAPQRADNARGTHAQQKERGA